MKMSSKALGLVSQSPLCCLVMATQYRFSNYLNNMLVLAPVLFTLMVALVSVIKIKRIRAKLAGAVKKGY